MTAKYIYPAGLLMLYVRVDVWEVKGLEKKSYTERERKDIKKHADSQTGQGTKDEVR